MSNVNIEWVKRLDLKLLKPVTKNKNLYILENKKEAE